MVKGTTQQVIVVRAPESALFDEAIFLIRPGAAEQQAVTDRMLLEEAVGEKTGCGVQSQAEADVLQGEKNTKQSAQRPEGDQQENTGTEVTKDRRSGRKAVMTTGQGENKDAVD